jgi:hypothetical protein
MRVRFLNCPDHPLFVAVSHLLLFAVAPRNHFPVESTTLYPTTTTIITIFYSPA